MKRLSSFGIALAAFGLGMVISANSNAKGSSHPLAGEQSSTGFVPVEVAQRAITFSSNRHWHDTDGNLLICAFEARSNSNMECEDKKTGASRWMPLADHKIPGFEIAGFQYSFVGSYGSQTLVVYYRPVKPASAVQKVETKVVSPTFSGPITIKADRVIVQRKK